MKNLFDYYLYSLTLLIKSLSPRESGTELSGFPRWIRLILLMYSITISTAAQKDVPTMITQGQCAEEVS